MIQRAIGLCIWVQAVALIGVGLWGVPLIAKSEDSDAWIALVVFCSATFLPAAVYGLLLRGQSNSQTKNRPFGLLLVASVLFYLPTVIVMATAPSGWGSGAVPAYVVLLFLFLGLWLFCAYFSGWLGGDTGKANDEEPRRLERWFQRTRQICPPPVMFLAGAILLATGYLLYPTNANQILRCERIWITAEYGLGHGLRASNLVLTYLGPLSYGAALLLAAATMILLLLCTFSSRKLRASRVVPPLKAIVVPLTILTVADYFYSWIWFLAGSGVRAIHMVLIVLFLAQWMVPVLSMVATRQ